MKETLNLQHIHVLCSMLLDSSSPQELAEYGKSIKTWNMNERTKEVARELYTSRMDTILSKGNDINV